MKSFAELFRKSGNLPIRTQLATLFALLIAGICLFIFTYFPNWLEKRAFEAVDNKARSIAEMTAFSVSPGMFFDDVEAVEEAFKGAQQNKDLVYLVVLNDSGETFCAFNENRADPARFAQVKNEAHISADGMIYEVTAPILQDDVRIGELYLGLSLQALRAETRRSRTTIAAISVAIFVLGTIAVFGIGTLITGPLSLVVKTVENIAKGDLTQRADIPSQYEIAHLAGCFNRMVDSLELAQGELEDANRNLENRVEERTKKLQEEIVQHKETEQNLIVAKEEAETASRTKSTFLANMSHELRTPLNAIIGYSEMLIEDAEDLEANEFIPDLRKIQTSGKHLFALISAILDISKIEVGKMELHLETFDVSQLIQDVVTTIEPLSEENQNTLAVECDDDLGAMHTDLTKLRQCVLNLMSNACKFTERGDVTLEVTREMEGDGDFLYFRISDTGIGISPEQIEHLFEAFSQADPSTTRKYGGTGLGLAISQKFCEMMEGEITVESELGVGSTFTMRMPDQATGPQFKPVPAAATTSRPPDGSNTLLVIDDDPDVPELIARFLAKEGFQVVTAASGEEGIQRARELRPIAILLDVMMPAGMDGWAVLSTLKSTPELADIPVLMLTIVDEKNRGYALGASDYLTKPIDPTHLKRILRKYKTTQPPGQVLVVEDDDIIREMMRHMLEMEGWSVTEAENGRTALEQVAQDRPTLILLDLVMPEMDGFEFVMMLQQTEAWRSIPVVVITGKELTPVDHLLLSGSVEKILQKGLHSLDELLHQVRDLVKEAVDSKTEKR